MNASATITRQTSQHGVRVISDGIAFELLCEPGLPLPAGMDDGRRPFAHVLCSVAADLPSGAGAGAPGCVWRGDRATIRARGVTAVLRHLAPRRYAVAAHVSPEEGLEPLLAAVAEAVRRRG